MVREPLATAAIVYPSRRTRPLWAKPSLRTNIIMTVMTAGLENPATASSGVTRLKSSNAPREARAVTSMGSHSKTNAVTVRTRMTRRMRMDGSMCCFPGWMYTTVRSPREKASSST